MTKMNDGRVDWQTVTLAIRRHYKPLAKVAKEINSEERHLNRLARGEVRDTKYLIGCRLLRIYADICKKLNRQPEWIDHSETIHAERKVRLQTPELGYPVPDELLYCKPSIKTLPELARKLLNRSNA